MRVFRVAALIMLVASPAFAQMPNPLLPRNLSPWGMFLNADIVVKAVMIGLALASLATWTVWLVKTIELRRAKKFGQRRLRMLESGGTLSDAVRACDGKRDAVAQLILSTAREAELSDGIVDDGFKERVALRLERVEAAMTRQVSRGIGILATIGATAPFVGLFGTVWGIMNSFIGISESHTTNLAVVAPGIAEALHHHLRALDRNAQVFGRALYGVENAAAGGFIPSQRAAQGNRFAGHHPGDGIAFGHAIGIHDPGHHLRVGVDIRSRNVLFRTNEWQNRTGITASHVLKFRLRHLFGIAGYSPFASAKWNVDHCALPSHPSGEGFHFIKRNSGMIPDSTFGWAPRRAVLNSVALKLLNMTVVHPHREGHLQDPLRVLDHIPNIDAQVQCVRREIKILHGGVIGCLHCLS